MGRRGAMVVIAIDGPSGSGKSSASKAVARTFNWEYLDTGALYRTLTLFAIESNVSQISQIPKLLPKSAIRWDGNPLEPKILLDGRNVNSEIRTMAVTNQVSEIAADPVVRAYLLEIQREIINNAARGIVVEGRDIGTTVWPDAELKIFLTADLEARAARRSAELNEKITEGEVGAALSTRDAIDSNRSTSPLRKNDDQVVVDATHLTLNEVVDVIIAMVKELRLSNGD